MLWIMLGQDAIRRGRVFVLERYYWNGKPLPIGRLRFRFLLTASQRGYYYPGKHERDCLGEPTEVLALPGPDHRTAA